jgi:hypothetical protein
VTEPTLFDMDPLPSVKGLSADRRRTLRQAMAISQGIHPLGLVFSGTWMHPQASRQAKATDPKDLPFRCGSCRWRELWSVGSRTVPKCSWTNESPTDAHPDRGGPVRLSHSVATDVRAWWPACTDYTPGDPSISTDAARFLPEEC